MEAGLPTARTRRATLAAGMLGIAASLPDGEPLRTLAEATPTRRLKTTTGWRGCGRDVLAQLDRHINFEERLRITVPPWCAPEGVTFSLEVGPNGRRDRPPDIRRRAAEDRLAELPSEATWIWKDGSASGGVMDGGGVAAISFPSGDTREVRVAAGSLSSSTRAELFALRAALEELSGAETRADSLPVVVCTDSMAALAPLRSGPAAQRASVVAARALNTVAAIWELLRPLADRGQPVYMRWVPAHCGLPGNERADALDREASALPQHETPIDTGTVQKAVARSATPTWHRSWPDGWFRTSMGNRLPGPIEEEDRLAAVDVQGPAVAMVPTKVPLIYCSQWCITKLRSIIPRSFERHCQELHFKIYSHLKVPIFSRKTIFTTMRRGNVPRSWYRLWYAYVVRPFE